MSDIIVAPVTRDLDILGRQLETWLGTHLDAASNIQVDNLTYPRGAGLSHETIMFDVSFLQAGQSHKRGCVVRIKPTGHQVFPDTLFDEQYQLMAALHKHGKVRVAEPYWFEADASLLGAPFFVMEKKKGRVPVSMPPYRQFGWVSESTPAQRAKFWENGVRELAAIQSMPLDNLSFLRGATEGAREGLAQEWDKYRRFVRWAADDRFLPVFNAALDRLEKLWPRNQPAGLVWGDARLGNIMFDDNFEVVAVMDWEQPSLGGALHDLSWWLVLSETMHGASETQPHLEGMGSRADTIALWHEITGISTDDIEWYEEFTQVKLSCTALTTAKLGRYPEPDPVSLGKRMKVYAS